MIGFGLVRRYVDGQKEELLNHLWMNDADEPGKAIDISGLAVKPSILRDMVNRKIVLRTPAGNYYVDITRVDRAHGTSGKFILYAMGFMVLAIVATALLSSSA
jgi:hypothetical protein